MVIIYHMHGVGEEIFHYNLKKNYKDFISISYLNKCDEKCKNILNSKENLKIITIVKNPLNRNFDIFLKSNSELVDTLMKKNKYKDLGDAFMKKYDQSIPNKWYLNEFIKYLEIDSNNIFFDIKKGYYIQTFKNKEILIIRYEDIKKNITIIKNFLDLKSFNYNAEHKIRYKNSFGKVIKYLPENFIKSFVEYDYYKKFYSYNLNLKNSVLPNILNDKNKNFSPKLANDKTSIYSNDSNNEFHEFLKDKSIAIVGPAPYLINFEDYEKRGKFIDSHDIIIMINRGLGLIKSPENYGSRCDILYHCLNEAYDNGGNIDISELKKCGVKYLRCCYPPLSKNEKSSFKGIGTMKYYDNFVPKYKILNKIKFSFVSKEFYLYHENILKTRPNSGIVAILEILQSKAKSVYITGFTFFKDGYNKLYRDSIDGKKIGHDNGIQLVEQRLNKSKNHNQDKIIKYLEEKIINNKKVIIDKKLNDIFDLNLRISDRIYENIYKVNNINKIEEKIITINEYFDRIFIINLERDKSKKHYMIKLMEKIGITNYEFYNAVDGEEKNYDDFIQQNLKSPLETIWEKKTKKKHLDNKYQLGCLLSHFNVISLAKERQYKNILILEDDVIPINNFSLNFKNYQQRLKNYDWDMLYLGSSQCTWTTGSGEKAKIEYISKDIYRANISCGTFSYGINNRIYDVILNLLSNKKKPIDSYYTENIQPNYNVLVLHPNLFISKLDDSKIFSSRFGIENDKFKDKKIFKEFGKKYMWNLDLYDF